MFEMVVAGLKRDRRHLTRRFWYTNARRYHKRSTEIYLVDVLTQSKGFAAGAFEAGAVNGGDGVGNAGLGGSGGVGKGHRWAVGDRSVVEADALELFVAGVKVEFFRPGSNVLSIAVDGEVTNATFEVGLG